MTTPPPVEYQAAAALAGLLRIMPDEAVAWPDGVTPVAYQDRVANMVVFTVNGMVFHATVTAA